MAEHQLPKLNTGVRFPSPALLQEIENAHSMTRKPPDAVNDASSGSLDANYSPNCVERPSTRQSLGTVMTGNHIDPTEEWGALRAEFLRQPAAAYIFGCRHSPYRAALLRRPLSTGVAPCATLLA